MAETVVVLCTCPDEETAAGIARRLVDEALAACVNRIKGIGSTYRWQESVEEDEEVLLVIKTRRSCFEALEHRIMELHPYELPEVIAVPIDAGSQAYLDWIAANSGTADAV